MRLTGAGSLRSLRFIGAGSLRSLRFSGLISILGAACSSGDADLGGLAAACERTFEGTICEDGIDDDCDGGDEECPATRPFSTTAAWWDCRGTPPRDVLAFVRFSSSDRHFRDGACLVFSEGAPDEIYVSANSFARTSYDQLGCTTAEGCTCPSFEGLSSHDDRLFAFSVSDEDCPGVALTDEGITSNPCRRPIIAPLGVVTAYRFVGRGKAGVMARLRHFSTIELACASFEGRPFTRLSTASVQLVVR